MRKKLLCGMMLAMGLVMALGQSNDADAKSKKAKVSYTIKKGTLTVKGKGAMPASMKFSKIKKAKNVKKIVVKKGITSVGIDAFRDLKKVKTITVANSVKKIGRAAFKNCKKLQTLTIPGDFKVFGKDAQAIDKDTIEANVNFNSKFNPEMARWINCENFNVMKKDPKYTSIKGIVYTKDKKRIVRVPTLIDKVEIAKGCEVFDLESIYFDRATARLFLSSITLPETVNKVVENESKYYPIDKNTKLDIRCKKLDGISMYYLVSEFYSVTWDKMKELFSNEIVEKDNVMYTKSGILLTMVDKDKEVATIPEGITTICNCAFTDSQLKEITIPKSVVTIGNAAFFESHLSELVIPATVKKVGWCVCKYCDDCTIIVEGNTAGFNVDFAKGATASFKSFDQAIVGVDAFYDAKYIYGEINNIDGATSYEVELCSKSDFKKPFAKYTLTREKNEYRTTRKSSKEDVKIYVRVRPVKKSNGKTVYGKWSTKLSEGDY